jgi:3-phosphoglycerate kinase
VSQSTALDGSAGTYCAPPNPFCEHDRVEQARDILEKAKGGHREIVLPLDVVTAEKLEPSLAHRLG